MPDKQHCGEHSGFNERITTNSNDIGELKETSHAIFRKLDDLTGQLLSRHGWGTTVLISVLVALVSVAIAVAIATHDKGG